MTIPDDPRLTTYVVDEVDPETAAAVEEALRAEETRAEAEAIGAAARLLTEALREDAVTSLRPEQHAAIARAAARSTRVPRTALWAGLAAAVLAAVAVPVWRAVSGRPVASAVAQPSAGAPPTPSLAAAPITSPPAHAVTPSPAVPGLRPADGPTTIHGVVTDHTGAPLPGATIVARSSITGRSVTTTSDARGRFTMSGQLSGTVRVEAQLVGFKSVQGELLARPRSVVSWEPTLHVGAITETVTVAGAAEALAVEVPGGLEGGVPGGVVGGVVGGLPDTMPLMRGEREFNTEAYAYRADNDFLDVARHPVSTFSVDVDTASYANVRRFLNEGALPPVDAVRIEEMVNYFPYDYPAPGRKPFAAHLELGPAPWKPEHRLLRIGLKAREIAEADRPASNLVFLVDVSGSMEPPNKLPLVKRSLEMLVERLDERDRVAIAVYAGAAGLVLPSTSGADKRAILRALDNLKAGGSTNGAQGIQLAYDMAAQGFLKGGNNRVVLATDGDFNVGTTDHGSLTRLIQERAKEGVFLSVLGFGMGNYKDATLELLADNGNGNYAYIDTANEARKALVEELTATLVTVAQDVKIQVEFNPVKVRSYRLLGYENRLLRPEEFHDDQKDAGEVGAGHAVTALYEIVPVRDGSASPSSEPLRYQDRGALRPAARGDELMRLRVRYKEPAESRSRLLEWPVRDRAMPLAATSPNFRFAAAVATFGMILRSSPHAGSATLDDVRRLAERATGPDAGGYRAEFLELVGKARALRVRR